MARLLFVNHVGRLTGASQSLLKLLEYLSAKHDTTVIVPEDGDFVSAARRMGVECVVHQIRHRHLPYLTTWIWRGNYDLLYGNNFSNAAYRMLFAAKLLHKPFIWHVREVFRTDSLRDVYRRLRHADAIIAVSEGSAQSVKRYLPERQVTVVHNGVDLRDFALARDEAQKTVRNTLGITQQSVIVTNVGRLCEQKNQIEAIRIAAKVAKEHSDAVFCFLGPVQDKNYVAEVNCLVDALGIQNRVKLTGFRHDVATFLRGSDVLLHVSVQEAHPRAAIEAMAAELPVVAYDVPGGMRETVISGKTGYLVQFGDLEGISRALLRLVTDAASRQHMGAQGREHVLSMFTAEKTAHKVDAVIQDVLK